MDSYLVWVTFQWGKLSFRETERCFWVTRKTKWWPESGRGWCPSTRGDRARSQETAFPTFGSTSTPLSPGWCWHWGRWSLPAGWQQAGCMRWHFRPSCGFWDQVQEDVGIWKFSMEVWCLFPLQKDHTMLVGNAQGSVRDSWGCWGTSSMRPSDQTGTQCRRWLPGCSLMWPS
jgi:hypothetical protein